MKKKKRFKDQGQGESSYSEEEYNIKELVVIKFPGGEWMKNERVYVSSNGNLVGRMEFLTCIELNNGEIKSGEAIDYSKYTAN